MAGVHNSEPVKREFVVTAYFVCGLIAGQECGHGAANTNPSKCSKERKCRVNIFCGNIISAREV